MINLWQWTFNKCTLDALSYDRGMSNEGTERENIKSAILWLNEALHVMNAIALKQECKHDEDHALI